MEAAINTLPDEQKQVIRAAHQTGLTAAIDQAKLDFRAGVAGSKKPEVFDRTKMSIQAYMDKFEPFRAIMGLEGRPAMQSFLTYLDTNSQATLIDNKVLDSTTWDQFKARVVEVLSPPQARVAARFEIKRASQKINETVEEFGRRLIELGRTAYTTAERVERNSALKDALAGGVRRDAVAVHLMNATDKPFSELLEEATRLDASYLARESLRSEDQYSVSVMKTEATSHPGVALVSNDSSSQMSSALCYVCNQPGHYASQCHLKLTRGRGRYPQAQYGTSVSNPFPNRREQIICYYCSKPNHIARDCFTRQRDMRQAGSMGGGMPVNNALTSVNNRFSNQNYFPDSYNGRGVTVENVGTPSSGTTGPLNDRESNAYKLAVERQARRDFTVRNGNSSSEVKNSCSPSLGFEPYKDKWSPEHQVHQSRGTSSDQTNYSTLNNQEENSVQKN